MLLSIKLFGDIGIPIARCAPLLVNKSERAGPSAPLLTKLFFREISGKKGDFTIHTRRILNTSMIPVVSHFNKIENDDVRAYLVKSFEDITEVCDQFSRGKIPDLEDFSSCEFVESLEWYPLPLMLDLLLPHPALTETPRTEAIIAEVLQRAAFCRGDLREFAQELLKAAPEGPSADTLQLFLPFYLIFQSDKIFKGLLQLEEIYACLLRQMPSELEQIFLAGPEFPRG